MSTPEGILKANVTGALKKSGVFFLRLNSGLVKVRGGFLHLCPEGTSDFVTFPDGEACWLELKAPGQLTKKSRVEKQAVFAEQVKAMGHRHAICTSVEEVMKAVFPEGK